MSSRRIEDLHHEFRPMVKELLRLGSEATTGGWVFFITDGYRSLEEQQRLYNQGRTAEGNIVTMAKPGQSPHNYGLAVDMAFQKNGVLSYDPSLYEPIYKIARMLGFTVGADWTKFPDRPHFEHSNWRQMINEGFISTDDRENGFNNFGEVYQLTRNIKVTEPRGVKVRFSPITTSKVLTVFDVDTVFAVKGFVEAHEVSGNNKWWVTKDDYYIWAGATNYNPKVPSEPVKVTESQEQSETSTPISEDVEVEKLLEQNKLLTRQSAQWKADWKTANAKVMELEKDIGELAGDHERLRIDASNVIAMKESNESLSHQIGGYQNQIAELKKDLSNAYVQSFSGWTLIGIPKGVTGFARFPIYLVKFAGVLMDLLRHKYVIGWKRGASLYKADGNGYKQPPIEANQLNNL